MLLGYALTRAFVFLWVVITLMLITATTSKVIFGGKVGLKHLGFILVWPLAAFSKEGRKKLTKQIKEYK